MNRVDAIHALEAALSAERERTGAKPLKGTAELRTVRHILAKHGGKASQIIAILQDLQAAYHYLPEPELRFISRELEVPLTRLYAIATFYKAFRLVPRGRHEISLCMGTACHVRGAVRVKDALERELKIRVGGTTDDMRFSFETVRCLGCCGQAPVMMVDEELVSKLDHLTVGRALEKYK
ncbi:MAG TPA: NAD(P)H-dependent oxidoreductase subunit E [Candidatus Krumholzibacteriaceae bacterium]